MPVATLVAKGEADLGIQQLSELIGQPGIEVVGPLPPEIQAVTVFSAGVSAANLEPQGRPRPRRLLASAETSDTKRRYGMEPASSTHASSHDYLEAWELRGLKEDREPLAATRR